MIMCVSLGLNDKDNIAPIIIATCGIPFACVAGALAARMSLKMNQNDQLLINNIIQISDLDTFAELILLMDLFLEKRWEVCQLREQKERS